MKSTTVYSEIAKFHQFLSCSTVVNCIDVSQRISLFK